MSAIGRPRAHVELPLRLFQRSRHGSRATLNGNRDTQTRPNYIAVYALQHPTGSCSGTTRGSGRGRGKTTHVHGHGAYFNTNGSLYGSAITAQPALTPRAGAFAAARQIPGIGAIRMGQQGRWRARKTGPLCSAIGSFPTLFRPFFVNY